MTKRSHQQANGWLRPALLKRLFSYCEEELGEGSSLIVAGQRSAGQH